METSDLLKRVRQIEIKTRGLSNNIFAGQYHSAFKGKGMSFSEVREYQYGDDVRDIDWNVTARYNKPFVKVFEEERELTVMLLIDVSNSLDFGTVKQLKKDMVTEIAATKRCTTFMISDFIDENDFRNALTIANRKHDIVAIQVYDRRMAELPDVGLMKVRDAETGHEQWIDTSSRALRRAHNDWWIQRQGVLNETFTKSNVDSVSIRTDQDYVKSLLNLFAKRN